MPELTYRVREEAEAQGYSIRRLAKESGLNYETVLMVWHNRADPRIGSLKAIAQVLRVSVKRLIADTPNDEP